MRRISLAGSLWFVAFAGLVFAALRNATDFWVGLTFLLMLGLLCSSVLGAILERGQCGAWWLGFALFGWAYFLITLMFGFPESVEAPAKHLARQIFEASNRNPLRISQLEYERRHTNAGPISGYLFVLIFARAGAMVSCIFTKGLPWRSRPTSEAAPSTSPIP